MSRKIQCIITDDEPLARKGLKSYVDKIDFLELTAICEDALQLNSLLKKNKTDLLFLDIEMPYLTGIEFLKNLPEPPKVIFTTAYENYALQGFELDVLDYLLKPISFDRFVKAANRAFDYFSLNGNQEPGYLFIKVNNRLEKIFFEDILFIEAKENYMAIQTKEKKLLTHSTLKSLQQILPSEHFIQPHKSYLVNMQHITAIEGNALHSMNYQIPISKYLKDDVFEKVLKK